MKQIKKWSYLCILVVFGIGFVNGDFVGKQFDKIKGYFIEENVIEQEEENIPSEEIEGVATNISSGDVKPQDLESSIVIESTTIEELPLEYRNPEDVVYESVEDDYFSDAVFIGDSRTMGLFEYGGLEEISTFYASTGLTIYKLFDSPIVQTPEGKITVEEALSQRQFGKVYLMIGINEMGTGTVETFIEKYQESIAHIRELQPDAIIYLQGIIRVTSKRSDEGDYINNGAIDVRNVEIEKLANYVDIYYLDVNPLIMDDTGGMDPAYTFDGVHLKAQHIYIWKDFLKQHGVVLDGFEKGDL